jgi:hypothetical protein
LEITVDPTLCIRTLEGGGEVKIYTYDRNTLHVMVVPDPLEPGSWVILRIEEEAESE